MLYDCPCTMAVHACKKTFEKVEDRNRCIPDAPVECEKPRLFPATEKEAKIYKKNAKSRGPDPFPGH